MDILFILLLAHNKISNDHLREIERKKGFPFPPESIAVKASFCAGDYKIESRRVAYL